MKQGFPKKHRLTNRNQIKDLFGQGNFAHKFPLSLAVHESNDVEDFQILISVPKRIQKSAVHRNLIKRRIRNILRISIIPFLSQNSEKVFAIIYTHHEIENSNQISKSLQFLFEPHLISAK